MIETLLAESHTPGDFIESMRGWGRDRTKKLSARLDDAHNPDVVDLFASMIDPSVA